MSVSTPRGQTRDQLAALYEDAAARLTAIPGVRSVAASGTTPIALGAASRFLRAEGSDEPVQNRPPVRLTKSLVVALLDFQRCGGVRRARTLCVSKKA